MNTRPCRNVYVHVPFCNGKCAYCAFYSEPEVNPASVTQWLDRLENDAARKSEQTLTLDTLYIGGGTPTALPPEALKRLFRILERHFSFQPGAEISIECNPESLTDQLRPILSNEKIFFTDLYANGLGEKIEEMFREMIAGKGAVRATVYKYM